MKKYALFYDYLNGKNVFELTNEGPSHYTFTRLGSFGRRGAIMVPKKEKVKWLSKFEVAIELLEK